MDTSYGGGIDPTPYMIAAYGIAVFILVGYSFSIYLARSKVRRLMMAMSETPKTK